MKYAISTLALMAVFFAAGVSRAETASVAEALRQDGCVLSKEVEVDVKGVFEAGDVACEDGNYDVELDAEFNVLTKVKEPPVEGSN